jgi:hypothetical protein
MTRSRDRVGERRRGRRGGRGWAVAAVLLAAAALTAGAASETPEVSDRSLERVRLDCITDLGHREVTLFANGTVRLRRGKVGRETMALAELAPDEVEGTLAALSEIDLSETDPRTTGPSGAWVERCRLVLDLAGRPRLEIGFSRFDSLSLALARVLTIVDTLAERAAAEGESSAGEHLPAGYTPWPGDLLRRRDGEVYEVIGFTVDDRGVELLGRDVPLTLYVARDQLAREFVELVEAAKPLGPGGPR